MHLLFFLICVIISASKYKKIDMKYFYIIFIILFPINLRSYSMTQWKEHRTILLSRERATPHTIYADSSIDIKVKLSDNITKSRKRLRIVGKSNLPSPFTGKGEGTFRTYECLIDDCLDTVFSFKDKYSLYLRGKNENFLRSAFYRISNKDLDLNNFSVILPVVKTQNLKISDNGYLGLRIEIYYERLGRNINDIYDKPDSTIFMNIKEGNNGTYIVKENFVAPFNERVACLLLSVGGKGFDGECWVEAPYITNKKIAFHNPFKESINKKSDWVGVNLSRKCWQLWEVKINNKIVFFDETFDRASNIADFYIPLPDSIKNGDKLSVRLIKKKYGNTYPYDLYSVELLEESSNDFEIISVPKFVNKESVFSILVETNVDNVELYVSTMDDAFPKKQVCRFKKKGLHIIKMMSNSPGGKINLEFLSHNKKVCSEVKQVIDKVNDSVYLSSGDEIYIPKDEFNYDYFFKWYISNRIGNWYQFRPSYQWAGTRVVNNSFVRKYVEILDELEIPYAWQVEGRTLAAERINPDLSTLNTKMFRGKQAHENDGAYYYWQHFKYNGLHSDLSARVRPYGGIFAKHRPIFTNHGTFIHYDTNGIDNMKEGADLFIENLKYSKGESSRHTGPSTLFRYFYQAGYDWLGAEQMYGAEEVVLSSLRGASKAYNKKDYGSLHAMQWGRTKYTDPKHALRFYISMALSYIHGSSHINTEEGLWTTEHMFDRFSLYGKEHIKYQNRILDYIETHTRKGKLKTKIAIIQGRNDAWKSYDKKQNIWSQKDEKWKINDAIKSFDLLNIFYPNNVIDACGPEGWFSRTPYGCIDIVPIEAPLDILNQYKVVIFLGWNTYDKNDFIKLNEYTKNGGIILLTSSHINENLQPNEPPIIPVKDKVLEDMLGTDYYNIKGRKEINLGAGKIIYYSKSGYPYNNSIREAYTNDIINIVRKINSEEFEYGWIVNSGDASFTTWDDGKKRTIYLVNVNWQKIKEEKYSCLQYGKYKFNIPVRLGYIETVFCSNSLAIHPMSNTTEVLDVIEMNDKWKLVVQNSEPDSIHVMSKYDGNYSTICINKTGINILYIKK